MCAFLDWLSNEWGWYIKYQGSYSNCLIQYNDWNRVPLTISENIAKPWNKLWMLCSDAWENLHKTHMCLGQGLGVSVQLKKLQNLFCGFGIFSEIVRVTLFLGHTVHTVTCTSIAPWQYRLNQCVEPKNMTFCYIHVHINKIWDKSNLFSHVVFFFSADQCEWLSVSHADSLVDMSLASFKDSWFVSLWGKVIFNASEHNYWMVLLHECV